MSNLPLRTLGRSKVAITRLGLGVGALGGFGAGVSYEQFERVARAAFDRGARYFDCAPMYGFGKSEHHLGHFLRVHSLRDQVVISTKVGRVLRPVSRLNAPAAAYGVAWVDSLPFRDVFDYSYDGILRSFEDSQQRLGLDFIDILFVHDIGSSWHGDGYDACLAQLRGGGYRALDELRAGGAVGAIGLGVNETESVLQISAEFELDCSLIAGRHTLLNDASKALEQLAARHVDVIAGGVFNSGILAVGPNGAGATYDYRMAPPGVRERARALEAVCEAYSIPLAVAALQYVLKEPHVAGVLFGTASVAEVESNLDALSVTIPDEFWRALLPDRFSRHSSR